MLLDRKDRMSMAVGLEVRVPFCDHRLVEYVYNAPWALKTYDGREKSLLRGATRHVLPESVAERVKSPYPSTQDPRYAASLQQQVKGLLAEPDAEVFALVDRGALERALDADPAGWTRVAGTRWRRRSTCRPGSRSTAPSSTSPARTDLGVLGYAHDQGGGEHPGGEAVALAHRVPVDLRLDLLLDDDGDGVPGERDEALVPLAVPRDDVGGQRRPAERPARARGWRRRAARRRASRRAAPRSRPGACRSCRRGRSSRAGRAAAAGRRRRAP